MAGKSDAFELDTLKLNLNATPIANLADNAASSPLAQLYFALHTADPGEAGNQSTNEVTYPGYARVGVARTSAALPVTQTGGITSGSPASVVSFPAATGGLMTATHWSLGVAASGATKILYSGVIGSALGAFTAATSGVFTCPGHGLAVNDRVVFASSSANALPTGITDGTIYYVAAVPSTDTFTIATASGGAAIASFTASGHGAAFKDQGIGITQGVTPQLSTATTIVED